MVKKSQDDIKNLIVGTAKNLFSKFGFQKTTMNEIAQSIHKAKGVLYYYFNNKEDLYVEVLSRELGEVQGELRKILNNAKLSATDKLEHFIKKRIQLLKDVPSYSEIIRNDLIEAYNFTEQITKQFDDFLKNSLMSVLNEGEENGSMTFKDMNITVENLFFVLKSSDISILLKTEYKRFEKTVNSLTDFIICGISSRTM